MAFSSRRACPLVELRASSFDAVRMRATRSLSGPWYRQAAAIDSPQRSKRSPERLAFAAIISR
ncbi:hypothetical protein AB0M83_36665 [Amycolatopsis sp. NPDC051106]|uniref:hypothetical protein n=1 Tax=unclassified Amycolatopsis TaxID=2618356 RepID=UPI003414C686